MHSLLGAGGSHPSPTREARTDASPQRCLRPLYGAVVVTVVAVGMVQVTAHQVIGVIAVGNRLVPAARPVFVSLLVGAAVVVGRAGARVRVVDRQPVLLDAAGRCVVQMAVVQIIDVPIVTDAGVPAAGSVLVGVPRMLRTLGAQGNLLCWGETVLGLTRHQGRG